MRFKAKRPGHKKPIYEGRYEPSVQRTTGITMRLERFFDRISDWYQERVTNPKTGELVHSCDEPLSQHQGHGSAKKCGEPDAQQAVEGPTSPPSAEPRP